MYTRRQVQEYSLQHYSSKTTPSAAATKQLKCPPAGGWINTATTRMHGHYVKQKKPGIRKMNTLWFCLRSFRIGKLIILGLTIIGVTYGVPLTGKWHTDSSRVRIIYYIFIWMVITQVNIYRTYTQILHTLLYINYTSKNIWSKNKMLTCVNSPWWLHRVLLPSSLYFPIY